MSLDEKVANAKLLQKKGEFMDTAQQAGLDPTKSTESTEYAKSAKMVVDKMFQPYTKEDKQLLSRIPKNILPNTVMLVGIENAIEKLYEGDVELWDNKKKNVTLYLNSDNQIDPHGDNSTGMIKYRTVTQKGYAEAHYWSNYWHGIVGGLFMQLPAVEGPDNRANQGVAVVSAITNSDRALLEAQNNAQVGWFRRQYQRVFK
ncbi:MAG: hypothetical protein E6L03_09025 [Thaumarchaeota archaeon]|nr:MAG: hypothetical protein E6L03_09025 [Nitrososphaerota archaeon]